MSAGDDEVGRCADSEPFALRVTDDSMSPALPRGTVVVVDPSAPAGDGSLVVLAGEDGPRLRRLTLSGGRLGASREDGVGAAETVSRADIIGVVVQSAGRRRREHRRHD